MHTHPLPVGTRIRTLNGECDSYIDDDTDQDVERQANPGEIGTVIHEPEHNADQGWIYSVVFAPSEVWVFLDQPEIDDPTQYEVMQ